MEAGRPIAMAHKVKGSSQVVTVMKTSKNTQGTYRMTLAGFLMGLRRRRKKRCQGLSSAFLTLTAGWILLPFNRMKNGQKKVPRSSLIS